MIKLNQAILTRIKKEMPSGIYTPVDFFWKIQPNSEFYFVETTFGPKPECKLTKYVLREISEYYGEGSDFKDVFFFSAESCNGNKPAVKKERLDKFLVAPFACFVIHNGEAEALAAAKYYRLLLSDNWQELTGTTV